MNILMKRSYSMISLKIIDVKAFMSNILIHSTFDQFLMWEMDITTYNYFHISGKVNNNWYEEGEETPTEGYSYWKTVKPFAFQVMKGQKTPQTFKIVLQLSRENTQNILTDGDMTYNIDDISGLFLNIKFENNELHMITGTSLKTFTFDKSIDYAWDNYVRSFLKQCQITTEE